MFVLLKPGITIPFMRFAKPATLLSLLLVGLSVFALATKGLNWGLDFTGGTVVEVKFSQEAQLPAMREALNQAQLEGAVVQHFGSNRDVLIRMAPKGEVSQQSIADGVLKAAKQLDNQAQLTRVEFVGPAVGQELAEQGMLAIFAALACILIYVAVRFEWRMATGAVLSLAHDVIVTLGIFSWWQLEFDLTVLAAVLTVVGYSLNDTIVVFDRVREDARKLRNMTIPQILDVAMTETLGRTLITSGTTLFVVIALFAQGGPLIHGFATALLIGIGFGTYSSIYVASAWAMFLKMDRENLMPVEVEKEGADLEP
ncbi:protein translocase subunit SecF [Pseudaeromonas paramecii]|uniref:Protein-export membrane protein SecF n=1 Tax=Pseudaeromonas paramecii TaxID=2138166 RepID=A0ABP8Q7L6_9GAMM